MQFSVGLRNARGNAIETHVGISPTLEIRSGAKPANCAAADSGTLLCRMSLPSDWLEPAAAGIVTKKGTWSGTGLTPGTAAHFRIKNGASPTMCDAQGTVTPASASPTGDMEIDNDSIAAGQTVTVTLFSVSEGNA